MSMVFDIKPPTGMPLPEKHIFEQVISTWSHVDTQTDSLYTECLQQQIASEDMKKKTTNEAHNIIW